MFSEVRHFINHYDILKNSRKDLGISCVCYMHSMLNRFSNFSPLCSLEHWKEAVECVYKHYASETNYTNTSTNLVLAEDLASSHIYAILGCLISGLFLVILGICLRKNSRIDEHSMNN